MPVEINGKTYDNHNAAVSALKKSKPGIKDPDAYVATVERAQKKGQLLTRIANVLDKVSDSEETDKIKQIRKKAETYNFPENKNNT